MYIDVVPNRGSPPAVLLRESYREAGQVRKRTLANLSAWPAERVESLRLLLQGRRLVPVEQVFAIERSLPHGHVKAVLGTFRRLGLPELLATKRSRQRDLVLGLIAGRILHPASKLATTRLWQTTTLGQELDLGAAAANELYAALDWLAARQPALEQKLAARHLGEGQLVLCDVSSSYYYGEHCPLAQFGYSRDGKKGLPIIVYGVLTDAAGRPVAVEVFPGNTADPKTVEVQIEKLRSRFNLKRVVLVGDRGLLTTARLDELKEHGGVGWITALRSQDIRALVEQGLVERSLFDEEHLAEIAAPDYPGERLIVCWNPLLADERKRKRQELLAATEAQLERIARAVARRRKKLLSAAEIGVKVGAVWNRFKMAKHFAVEIGEGQFRFARKTEAIAREEALDGLYVIRTSEPAEALPAAEAVRSYKRLAEVERVFRGLKGLEVLVRPIHHWNETRVRAHLFLCLLAYYVEWHMKESLAPLLFADEERRARGETRDPVHPAEPSDVACQKRMTKRTADDWPAHSFRTLLQELATLCRNTCRANLSKAGADRCIMETEPTAYQTEVFRRLNL